jgi:alkylhydroperoxidase family enzyme
VAVPWIQQTDVEQAEGLLARIYQDAIKRAGRVWRIVKLQSLNPSQLRAGLGMYNSLMHRDSALPPRLRETLAIVVSRANECFY